MKVLYPSEFTVASGRVSGCGFIVQHAVAAQLPQRDFVEKPLFPHRVVLELLLQMSLLGMYGFAAGFSISFPGSTSPCVCRCHTDKVALYWVWKLKGPQTLFSFSILFCLFGIPLEFDVNWRVSFAFPLKEMSFLTFDRYWIESS